MPLRPNDNEITGRRLLETKFNCHLRRCTMEYFPDFLCASRMHPWHWVEMKFGNDRLSKVQKEMFNSLVSSGEWVWVVHFDRKGAAMTKLLSYRSFSPLTNEEKLFGSIVQEVKTWVIVGGKKPDRQQPLNRSLSSELL